MGIIVSDPDSYLLPNYRMSPFCTGDVHKNAGLPVNIEPIEDYFNERFRERNYIYTRTGKTALYEALSNYNLLSTDVVTIFTSTNNLYISSCVTDEIEKFCKWSRKLEDATKILLVNHEFGYPRKDLLELKKLRLPIIEDCAYTFLYEDEQLPVGQIGDFTIYSFPKIFPLQIGGLLTAKKSIELNPSQASVPDEEGLAYIQTVLSEYIGTIEAIRSKRRDNYTCLIQSLNEMGCEERLPMSDEVVPGACLFKVPEDVNLPEMKTFLWSRGVQCSIFYGEHAFFVPVHQGLKEEDLTYIINNIRVFLKR